MSEVEKIFEEAIEAEKAAQARYRRGMEAAEDLEVRAVFEQLLRDEEAHERVLKDRLKALKLMGEL